MDLHYRHESRVSWEELSTALRDPRFLQLYAQRTGAVTSAAEVHRENGRMSTHLVRTNPTDGVPSFLKPIVGREVEMTEVTHWPIELSAFGCSTEEAVRVQAGSRSGRLEAHATISPSAGGGCLYELGGRFTLYGLPSLLNGRAEPLAAELITSALAAKLELAAEWAASGTGSLPHVESCRSEDSEERTEPMQPTQPTQPCDLLNGACDEHLERDRKHLLALASPGSVLLWYARTDMVSAATDHELILFRSQELGEGGSSSRVVAMLDIERVEWGKDWFDWFVRLHLRNGEKVRFNTGAGRDPASDIAKRLEARAGEVRLADVRLRCQRMVGAETFQRHAAEVEAVVAAERRRKDAGLPVQPTARHVVMVGNPGTGKTTAARLLGSLFHELGALSRGHLVEATRADLVGEYVGQTALRTRKVLAEAQGGVLFVDEAYSLVPEDGRSDYGDEAIAELISGMENQRDDLVVVAAGYGPEMRRFLDSNPGLRSRFATTLEFLDLSNDQLFQVILDLALTEQYQLGPGAADVLLGRLEQERTKPGFGNARTARNIYEAGKRRHAVRAATSGFEDMTTLSAADFFSS